MDVNISSLGLINLGGNLHSGVNLEHGIVEKDLLISAFEQALVLLIGQEPEGAHVLRQLERGSGEALLLAGEHHGFVYVLDTLHQSCGVLPDTYSTSLQKRLITR